MIKQSEIDKDYLDWLGMSEKEFSSFKNSPEYLTLRIGKTLLKELHEANTNNLAMSSFVLELLQKEVDEKKKASKKNLQKEQETLVRPTEQGIICEISLRV